jgi:hypothetical protein
MMKKIATLSLCAVMVTVVVLFTTTEVMAQQCSDPPTMCTTPGGWRIFAGEEIDGITYGECMGDAKTKVDHDGDPLTPEITFYPCDYVVCKPGTGPGTGVECDSGRLNHVLMAVKKCCPEDIVFDLVSQVHPPTVIPYGEGDPVFGWLAGYYQARVLRIPPQNPAEHVFGVISSAGNTGETTICLKSKNSLECCPSIIGLECPEPPPEFAQSAVNTMTYVTTVDGRQFKQMLDPTTQCPTEIWEIIPCGEDTVERNGEVRECTAGEMYEWLLDKLPSEQVLTAQHDGDPPAGVVSIANPGSGCGGAILQSDSENSWFFCFFGWCFF